MQTPSRTPRISTLLAGFTLLSLTGACGRSERGEARASEKPTVEISEHGDRAVEHSAQLSLATELGAEERARLLAPYAQGAWRRSNPEALREVLLWFSHILVRHRDVSARAVSFDRMHWSSVAPAAERSRQEAAALAARIAARAERQPAEFAALAREYSDDIATRDTGGAFGVVRASSLRDWPEVLDALSETAPGAVSRVVETAFGFHVFLRSPPPPEGSVSGEHIVIGHEHAGWLPVLTGEVGVQRTRDDAHALAMKVYEQALQHPEQFGELVASYSEHPDRMRSGDLGAWPTQAWNGYPREIEVLRQLAVGEVAPPIDSPLGFQILRRTPDHPRSLYAMTGIWLPFNPAAAPASQSSRGSVLSRARELARQVDGDVSRFAELQKNVCCTYNPQWVDGQGSPSLTALLDGLAVGQVALEPVQSEAFFVIGQRRMPHEPGVSAPASHTTPAAGG